jgi:hypothetical protein
MLRQTIALIAALLVGAAVFVWAETFSSSFQNCVNEESAKSAADQGDKKNQVVVAVVRCTVRFADRHNAFITALATLLLAVITFGLIWSGVEQQNTTRAQLRAYVLPNTITVIAADQEGTVILPYERIVVGRQPVAAIEWKNFGQTPAFDVEIIGNVCLIPWPIDPALFPAQMRSADRGKFSGRLA